MSSIFYDNEIVLIQILVFLHQQMLVRNYISNVVSSIVHTFFYHKAARIKYLSSFVQFIRPPLKVYPQIKKVLLVFQSFMMGGGGGGGGVSASPVHSDGACIVSLKSPQFLPDLHSMCFLTFL